MSEDLICGAIAFFAATRAFSPLEGYLFDSPEPRREPALRLATRVSGEPVVGQSESGAAMVPQA
jgi:hypothetical protein